MEKEKQMFVTSETTSPQLRAAVNQSAKPETVELNEFLFFFPPPLTCLAKPSDRWVDICPSETSQWGHSGAWKGFTGLI